MDIECMVGEEKSAGQGVKCTILRVSVTKIKFGVIYGVSYPLGV